MVRTGSKDAAAAGAASRVILRHLSDALFCTPLLAILGNPLFLVKARQQAYSPHFQIGRASYNYKNAVDGLRSIVQNDGFRGLARGMDAAILRTSMGSTVSGYPKLNDTIVALSKILRRRSSYPFLAHRSNYRRTTTQSRIL